MKDKTFLTKIIAIIIIMLPAFIIMFYFYSMVSDIENRHSNFASQESFLDEAEMTYPETAKKEETRKEIEKINEKNKIDESQYEEIDVNMPIMFSKKTKAEIYKIRKKVVQNSIFASKNYTPSEDVFGQIVDRKPWINADVCTVMGTGHQGIDGPSEEARFILNPTLLVAVEFPFHFTKESPEWCTSRETELIPQQILYSRKKNEILVKYRSLAFTTISGRSYFFIFNGLNARDLGYKYAYVDMRKSSFRPAFTDSNNIGNNVIEFQNYIHLGSSCGYETGCNNGSPRQSFLEFRYDIHDYEYRNREIYIKLWKNQPSSPNDKADITERIILDWS